MKVALTQANNNQFHTSTVETPGSAKLAPPVDGDRSILDDLSRLHRAFCERLGSGAEPASLMELQRDLQSIRNNLDDASPRAVRLANKIMGKIERVTFRMAVLERESEQDLEMFRAKAAAALNSQRRVHTKSGYRWIGKGKALEERRTKEEDRDSLTNYDPWRRWMLDNLDNPYPDTQTKVLLLQQIPSLKVPQLNTWFSNIRRRSGWTEVFRVYADSKLANVRKLLHAIDAGEDVLEGARDAVEKVRVYLKEEGRDKISSWMDEVISKHGGTSGARPNSTEVTDSRPYSRTVSSTSFVSSASASSSDLPVSASSPENTASPSYDPVAIGASTPASEYSTYCGSSPSSSDTSSVSSSFSSISSLGIGFPPTASFKSVKPLEQADFGCDLQADGHSSVPDSPSQEWPRFNFSMPPIATAIQPKTDLLPVPFDVSCPAILGSNIEFTTVASVDPFSPSLFAPPDWSLWSGVPTT